jgi:hypothetical protein
MNIWGDNREVKAENFTPLFRDLERDEVEDFVKRERRYEFALVECKEVPEYSDSYFTKGKIYRIYFRLCGSFFTSCMGGYIETDREPLLKTFKELKRKGFEFI